MNKLISLKEAAEKIQDNSTVALGGNVLHRAPMAMVREMIRQGKKGLRIVKTAGAMDVDMLCLGDCVYSVDAGFISYETEYSLAGHYRLAVQSRRVKGNEHACYTVISALRAQAAGIPFMPVKGLVISDLIEANDYFARIKDPFSGEEVTVVKAIRPDVAVLHVQEADRNGNARITGPPFEDILMSRAAERVILTAENIVPESRFTYGNDKADIPHFLVEAVVKAPKGALPCSCPGKYEIDRRQLDAFKQLKVKEEYKDYLKQWEAADYQR